MLKIWYYLLFSLRDLTVRLSTTKSVLIDCAAGVVGGAGGSDFGVPRSIATCIIFIRDRWFQSHLKL